MPDSREPNPMPRDWASAFAALPMETPPTDAWTSLARRLPHSGERASARKRNRRIYRTALAATVVLAAVIPLLHWHVDNTSMPPPVQGPIAESPLPLNGAASASLDDTLVAVAPASTPEPAPARMAAAKDIVHATRNAAATHPRKTLEIVPAPSKTGSTQLDALHMQSAGLEAALVEMQQPKVTNPGVEVISQHLAGTIGAIDEALAEGNQDENATLALWRQRNRLLVQMLEIELRNQQLLAQRATSPFEFSQVN
jgi:hypothetical protein